MIDEDSLQKLQKRNAAILLNWMNDNDGFFAAPGKPGRRAWGIAAVSRITRIAASTIGLGLNSTRRRR